MRRAIGSSLAASSSSESASFSVPLLLLAAAVGVAWVLLLTAFLAWRRPRDASNPAGEPGSGTGPARSRGPVVQDFELPADLPPQDQVLARAPPLLRRARAERDGRRGVHAEPRLRARALTPVR